ncbi:MAG: AAA family ATPase [Microthrixaceae bacterium]|nr:AAA family ATPase [Microthrixaceae bacterium]
MSGDVLGAVVATYIDDLTDALTRASRGVEGIDPGTFRRDVTSEAFALCAAMIDADGRHTDDELNALIDTFGPLMDDTSLLRATPADIRGTSLVAGRRAWVDDDTELFRVLVASDEANDTELADVYYQRTMEVAHVIASLDVVTSRDELETIATLRTRLLAGLRKRRGDGRSLTPQSPPAADAPPPSEDPPKRSMEELLAELDDLVGLDAVKDRVHLVADFLRVQQLRAERGLPPVETSHHLVFTGNPGTGKTTVARLLAQIFRTLGVVERGHLVEVDRAGLVAGYVGQTAPKVTAAFDAAEEGMLFIDEAYTLARGGENDFGIEAIDQIVKLIEDRRDRVVLVAAGYPNEMADFLAANPGLQSRLPTVIEFPDYDTDELLAIVRLMGNRARYHLSPEAEEALTDLLRSIPRGKGFGNARLARNIFEASINRHASRVVATDDPDEATLTTIEKTDIPPDADSIDEPPRRRSGGSDTMEDGRR